MRRQTLILTAASMTLALATTACMTDPYTGQQTINRTAVGIGVLFYVVGRYLVQGGAVPGFAFLASIIAIFSGAQLFALGIFGEYLARVFHRSTGQPGYTVRERTT